MSKDAIVFVLDVSSSMWQTRQDQVTRLDRAIQVVQLMLQQKLIDARKSDLVSLVLFGCPLTEHRLAEEGGRHYQHIQTVQELQTADLNLARFIQNDLPLGREDCKVDALDALIVAMDLLIEKTQGKKYTRSIYMLSDLCSKPMNTTGIDAVMDNAQRVEMAIDFIAFPLDAHHPFQENNLKCINQIVTASQGMVHQVDDALQVLSQLRSRSVRGTAAFRGTLSFGALDVVNEPILHQQDGCLHIPVALYTRSSLFRLPTAKKQSALAANASGPVERSVAHFKQDAAGDGEQVPPDELVKAYRYGKTRVQFSRVDEAQMALESTRCLSVIGLIPVSDIYRGVYMAGALEVVADGEGAARALTAIVMAMHESDPSLALLCRYVRQARSSPRLVALLPHIKREHVSLTMIYLPFSEDCRHFQFHSLARVASKASKAAREACDAWMDALDLDEASVDAHGERCEAYSPKHVHNVAARRLYDTLQAKAFDSTFQVSPELSPSLSKWIDPRPEIIESEEANRYRSVFAQAVGLQRVNREGENVAVHETKARAWGRNEMNEKESELKSTDNLQSLLSHTVERLGTADPISDLTSIESQNNEKLLDQAFEDLPAIISHLLSFSFAGSLYEKALQCLVVWRQCAIRHDKILSYNKYLKESRDSWRLQHLNFWQMLVSQATRVTLISQEESMAEGCVTVEESTAFMKEEEEKVGVVTTGVVETADDLMDLLE